MHGMLARSTGALQRHCIAKHSRTRPTGALFCLKESPDVFVPCSKAQRQQASVRDHARL